MTRAATRRLPVSPVPTRRPGRPAGGDAAVRASLLESARAQFLARGFASVTIRQIAAAAGSSPATIHYHFGDKLGLYRAMLEDAFAPVVEAMQRLADPARVDSVDITEVIRLYTRMLAGNPWVPQLIVQEVLAEGGRFRELFVEHFAGRLAPVFIGILRRAQARGEIRADVDPRLAALSAMSMTVFPFLALPVTSRVLGITLDDEFLDGLTRHTMRVLLGGIGAHEAAT
jgi:TetR/AcrR family transcriptional regulator